MKYTRYEFRHGRVIRPKKPFLLFLIIIPAIAVVAGLAISKYFLIPYLYKPESIESHDKYIYQQIKNRKYYIVQAGVFSSETNLELVMGKMKSSNLSAYVNHEEQLFRIITYISPDYDSARKEVDRYKSSGYSCIIKELNVSCGQVPDSLKSNSKFILLNRVVNFIGDEINTACGLLSEYDSKKVNFNSISEKLKGTSSEFVKITSNYKSSEGSDVQEFDEVLKRCETVDSTLGEISMLGDGINFYSRSQEIIIRAVYLYCDLIDSYNKNVL